MMSQRTRKFIGVWFLLGWLVAYPIAIAAIFGAVLANIPAWASLIAFVVFGALWAFPAGWIIRWMVKPAHDQADGDA